VKGWMVSSSVKTLIKNLSANSFALPWNHPNMSDFENNNRTSPDGEDKKFKMVDFVKSKSSYSIENILKSKQTKDEKYNVSNSFS
jgi:hypothetical protein